MGYFNGSLYVRTDELPGSADDVLAGEILAPSTVPWTKRDLARRVVELACADLGLPRPWPEVRWVDDTTAEALGEAADRPGAHVDGLVFGTKRGLELPPYVYLRAGVSVESLPMVVSHELRHCHQNYTSVSLGRQAEGDAENWAEKFVHSHRYELETRL
jgi:hypothetical protein